MNILIICTYYAPDTAIAAVRPYMLAKYLTRLGNKVTVLRSGLINKACDAFFEKETNIRIVSYMGENSPAERFERGETNTTIINADSRIAFIPRPIRIPIAKLYSFIMEPYRVFQYLKDSKHRQKRIEETLNLLEDETFDVVFSTYAELENIKAGLYASKKFHSKWIMDFRDLVSGNMTQSILKNIVNFPYERIALKKADLCTVVSNGIKEKYIKKTSVPIKTLYNGYEPIESTSEKNDKRDCLTIAYTGQLYGLRSVAFETLFEAINRLIKNDRIDAKKIEVVYAGADGNEFENLIKKYNLIENYKNKGYLKRSEIIDLQKSTDVFLLLSWNTRKEHGILTGKFYEGIRSNKPILAIVAGNESNSELHNLNKKYKYGFCYETCKKEDMVRLCSWIEGLYHEKMINGSVKFVQDKGFKEKFKYENIAMELDAVCKALIDNTTHEIKRNLE